MDQQPRGEEDSEKTVRLKSSVVWEHFTENKITKYVKCKLCSAEESHHAALEPEPRSRYSNALLQKGEFMCWNDNS